MVLLWTAAKQIGAHPHGAAGHFRRFRRLLYVSHVGDARLEPLPLQGGQHPAEIPDLLLAPRLAAVAGGQHGKHAAELHIFQVLDCLGGLGCLLRLKAETPHTEIKTKLNAHPHPMLASQGAEQHSAVVGAHGRNEAVFQDGQAVLLPSIGGHQQDIHAADRLRHTDPLLKPGHGQRPHALARQQPGRLRIPEAVGIGLQKRQQRRAARLLLQNAKIVEYPVGLDQQVHANHPFFDDVKAKRLFTLVLCVYQECRPRLSHRLPSSIETLGTVYHERCPMRFLVYV